MSAQMLAAIVLITLALVLYSVGVWAERLAGRLRGWHLAFFFLGLGADSSGTGAMFTLPEASLTSTHAVTGFLAIALMAVHAAWATLVLLRKREPELLSFHRFSLAVWLVWLVPYLNGFFAHMRH